MKRPTLASTNRVLLAEIDKQIKDLDNMLNPKGHSVLLGENTLLTLTIPPTCESSDKTWLLIFGDWAVAYGPRKAGRGYIHADVIPAHLGGLIYFSPESAKRQAEAENKTAKSGWVYGTMLRHEFLQRRIDGLKKTREILQRVMKRESEARKAVA